jgi:osmoprotectant transport system substrate-binding protein
LPKRGKTADPHRRPVFTEQTLLAEITPSTCAPRVTTPSPAAWAAHAQPRKRQLDLIWEYTGVSLVAYNHVIEKLTANSPTPGERTRREKRPGLADAVVQQHLRPAAGRWPRNILRSTASATSTCWRKPTGTPVALDTEFANRSDGLAGMVKLYDMNLTRKNTRRWTPAWSTPPCATARCLPWSTPPTVASTLQTAAGDDKHYFPDYTAAPVVRQVYLDAHPELAAELAPLAALFDDKTMRERTRGSTSTQRKPVRRGRRLPAPTSTT